MRKFIGFVLTAGVVLMAAPAFAGAPVAPAPIVGASLSGLVTLAVAAGGYLFLRFRRNKDGE